MRFQKKTKVQLTLCVKDLKKGTRFGKTPPDPYAVVSLLSNDKSEKPIVLGRTECVEKSFNPMWTKQFLIEYSLGSPVYINVGIYDRKTKDTPMGSAVFEIGEILGTPSNSRGIVLKKGGIVFATLQRARQHSSGRYFLGLTGVGLKNPDSKFGAKLDPFFEISRNVGEISQIVYRSEHTRKKSNPVWKVAVIDLDYLCGGNLNEELIFQLFDFQKSGRHQLMGEFRTTLNGMVSAHQNNMKFTIMKEGTNFGTIFTHTSNLEQYTGDFPQNDFSHVSPESHISREIPCGDGDYSERSVVSSFSTDKNDVHINLAKNIPNFVDYISANCELDLCVAIDFTKANGNPHVPGTLHHISNKQLNDYEKAIIAVASIVAKYDHDQKFPVWGFGAKIGKKIQNSFQVGKEEEVSGVKGLLDAYRNVFHSPLVMSGPADLTAVIERAAQIARDSLDNARKSDKLSYNILLILTSGIVSNVQETVDALTAASDAPLSIIIVGIGSANFTAMQFLDDFANGNGRDICQFVEFERHKHSKLSLTNETMEEIPDQLVNYFISRDLYPDISVQKSENAVPVLYGTDNFDDEFIMELDNMSQVSSNSYGSHMQEKYHQYDGGYGTNHQQPQMNAFKVLMPSGIMPGTQIEVESPFTGKIIEVIVPFGVTPGGTFIVNG